MPLAQPREAGNYARPFGTGAGEDEGLRHGRSRLLVAVMFRLERPGSLDADIARLFARELGKLDAQLVEVEASNLLVEVLGQGVDLVLVLIPAHVQFDLRERLVGERGRHHEARMAGGVAEVDEAAFRQEQDTLAIREGDHVDLRLDIGPHEVAQALDLDLVVEVADIADDRHVLHGAHMVDGEDVLVAGRGDEDVELRRGLVHGQHFIAVHGGLQGADRVDLGDGHAGARARQRGSGAFADVAVTGDEGFLAGHHNVRAAADRIHKRLFTAVLVVELRLGHRVIDVDRRERQFTLLLELVEAVNARRRLFRDAAHTGLGFLEPAGRRFHAFPDLGEEVFLLLRAGIVEDRGGRLCLFADDQVHGGVAAIVEDQVRALAVRPLEHAVGIVPVFFQRLALVGEDGGAIVSDRCGGVVLRRVDVAGDPAHLCAEGFERLDEDRGLDRHMERAADTRALKGLGGPELLTRSHQAGHFGFGDRDFLAAKLGERDVLDVVVFYFALNSHINDPLYLSLPVTCGWTQRNISRRLVGSWNWKFRVGCERVPVTQAKSFRSHSGELPVSLAVVELEIPDVKLVTPTRFGDARGFFSETFHAERFRAAGITADFVQDNHSLSATAGTVRGLHYQSPPFAQAKLVRVLRGAILDVAVDVRPGSATYGKWVKAELSAENGVQIFVPRGFLHGFVTCVPDTEIAYKVDNYYSKESDGAVRWDDPDLAIDWEIDITSVTLSAKDLGAARFCDFASPF